MRRLPATFLAALALAFALHEPALAATSTDSRAIYRVTPAKKQDVRPLLGLGLDPAGHGPGTSLDFVLTPAEVARVRSLGFEPVPVERGGPLGAPMSPLGKPGLGLYHTYSEALAEMSAYAASYPSIARLDTIGMSLEGRPIVAIEISDQVGIDESEPEALIVGCHHARELMSVEVPLYVMRRLLDGYATDPLIHSLVDSREIWIAPVVNPDGFVWVESHSGGASNGWWRKNRRPHADGTFGVDLNRNYGFEWGHDDLGSSPTPASETYRGTGPFSEPETAALRSFIAGRSFTVSASFHSYGNLVLYPWGYDLLDTPDHSVFSALADSMAVQNGYRAGNPKSNAIYLTNGDMDDWVYGEQAEKPALYGYTFEVNSSSDGFDPPESLIGPTCVQNFGPILSMIRFADQPRRVLGPVRPASVEVRAGAVLAWSYTTPDPANLASRHDVRLVDQVLRGTDDAESGTADWDTLRFEWSTARAASGTRSYHAGSGDNQIGLLTSRASLDVMSGDSVIVNAWWDLEPGYDYWYAQASRDGGVTWSSLAGTHTTNLDPSGNNEGFGVTGSSGGTFVRTAFSLLPHVYRQVLLRFRCVTDPLTHGEGLYIDDVTPTPRYSGVTVLDTGSPDTSFTLSPSPTAPVWLAVRGIDAEMQPSAWSDRVLYEPDVTGVAVSPGPAATDRIARVAPNPTNPRATVSFVLAAGVPGAYRIDCFDASGRWLSLVTAGADDGRGGARQVTWNGTDRAGNALPSGIYFLRLTHGSSRRSSKVTLLR